ncbi:MAG: maleylpyruvate isomerase family mycothiol-dependent enzyme [Candidatus Dormibacteraeota bacterium]|nr:maleylpyruvate isomerase family mycothiol-dependent enzyme [Candidatus Dormibacteraeota bacterium]
MPADPWPIIHAERWALVADLEPLSEQQWSAQSLCSAWTVRDVLAHMTATAKMTPPRFFGQFLGSGFRFNSVQEKGVAAERGSTGSDALGRFKQELARTTHPPGPVDAMVGEMIVHGEDIRRPLGIRHKYSDDALTTAVDFYRKSNLLIGAKRRADGLTLRATDVEWSAGVGPEVRGPLASIILAITGRRAGLEELEGGGMTTLTVRI